MLKRATASSVLLPGHTSPHPAQSVAGFGKWGNELESFSSPRPLYRNNHVDLLIDGPATYRKMLDSIRAARELVYLETYIFSDDEVGRRFASALKERRERGLTIAIIYDSVGSIGSDGTFFDDTLRNSRRAVQLDKPAQGEAIETQQSGAPETPGSG